MAGRFGAGSPATASAQLSGTTTDSASSTRPRHGSSIGAADPTTGWIYVGGQSGLSTIEVQHDPCSEVPYTSPHNSCGKPGAVLGNARKQIGARYLAEFRRDYSAE